ncbi:MAG: hypothetical protein KF708_05225 [Pirellulales bacterium]|nr:hypothetical protein [Pirellulales bacterium]
MDSIIRDVAGMDETQRRAMENVLGRELQANQRLIIRVTQVDECAPADTDAVLQRQSIEDWKRVYEGLDAEQVEAIDRIVNRRVSLSRHSLPANLRGR